MKQLIGKSCRLRVLVNGKELFYTVQRILDITNTHITFLDKYSEEYCYRLQDIIQIQEIK